MLRIFAVYDKAVGAFMAPFFVRATGEALRTFTDAVNDPQSPFYKHPADFELFQLGAFDSANGTIEAMASLRVITALDVLNKM